VINETFRRVLPDGTVVFVKTNPAGGFEEEAAGLRWLAEPGCIQVAEPLEIWDDPPALVLRWIERGTLTPAGEEELGRGLACLHRAGSFVFGGEAPLRIFSANEMYEVAGNRWIAKEPMLTARHGIGAAAVGNRIYVPAGGTEPGFAATAANEVYVP